MDADGQNFVPIAAKDPREVLLRDMALVLFVHKLEDVIGSGLVSLLARLVNELEELPDLANPKVHKVTTRQAKQVEQEVTRVLRKREQPKVDIPLPTQAQAKKPAKQPKPT